MVNDWLIQVSNIFSFFDEYDLLILMCVVLSKAPVFDGQ